MAVKLDQTKSMSKIQSITEKGITEANTKATKEIPLDLIDLHEMNSQIYKTEDLDGLCKSIESSGFFGAIELYQRDDGRYTIRSGHRRYLAMKQLGRKSITAIVYKMESPDIVIRKLIESNQNTRITSPMEKAMGIVTYENALRDGGFTGSAEKKLMEVFNLTRSRLYRLKRLVHLGESLKKYAYDLSFPVEAFEDAIDFSKTDQERLAVLIQEHIQEHPEAGLSDLVAKHLIEQVKSEIRAEKNRKEREKYLSENREELEKQLLSEFKDTKEAPIKTIEEDLSIDSKESAAPSPSINPPIIEAEPIPDSVELADMIDVPVVEVSKMSEPEDLADTIALEAIYPVVDIEITQPNTNNIDFDLTTCVDRMLNLVENKKNTVSADVKEMIIFKALRIVELLK